MTLSMWETAKDKTNKLHLLHWIDFFIVHKL